MKYFLILIHLLLVEFIYSVEKIENFQSIGSIKSLLSKMKMNDNKIQTNGKSSFISGERIIGGGLARNGEFPFAISLQTFEPNSLVLLCGGSIIDKYTILTAAHCVVGFV
jgi:hypothetical protein